jgi:hypothetical protein
MGVLAAAPTLRLEDIVYVITFTEEIDDMSLSRFDAENN